MWPHFLSEMETSGQDRYINHHLSSVVEGTSITFKRITESTVVECTKNNNNHASDKISVISKFCLINTKL